MNITKLMKVAGVKLGHIVKLYKSEVLAIPFYRVVRIRDNIITAQNLTADSTIIFNINDIVSVDGKSEYMGAPCHSFSVSKYKWVRPFKGKLVIL